MSVETNIATILEKLNNWDENGFPACGVHTSKIEQLEEEVSWCKGKIWGGLITILLGACSLIAMLGVIIWG